MTCLTTKITLLSVIVVAKILFSGKVVNGSGYLPYIKNGTCVPYKKVLPSGACLRYMENANVLMEVSKAEKKNERLQTVFDFIIPLLIETDMTKEGIAKLLWIYSDKCSSKGVGLKKLIKRLVDLLPTADELKNILPRLKWFLCHIRYPVCRNMHGLRTSLPCKGEVTAVYKKFKLMRFFRDNWQVLHKKCRKIFGDKAFTFVETGTLFVKADTKYIEKCQKYDNREYEEKRTNTYKCFENNGVNYKGSSNIAENGKSCIAWSSFPALHSKLYASLQKNYCRNPQGFGDKPWCYTDEISREWSYCQVKRCHSAERGFNPTLFICIVTVALVCIGLVTVFIIHTKGKRQWRNYEDEIDPDKEPHLNSLEQRELLLQYK